MSYAATTLSAEQPAAYDPSISQWESATGEPFMGKPIPLGALVDYRRKEPRHQVIQTQRQVFLPAGG